MGVLGILFIWIFYRGMTSGRRSLARQRRVAERYEREAGVVSAKDAAFNIHLPSSSGLWGHKWGH